MMVRNRAWAAASFALMVVLIGGLTWLFVSRWYLHFNSDTALIGLMAKYIQIAGERPLFVWSVGYQGMILEGGLGALMFHWFGRDPVTLNFAPTIFFLIFLVTFFLYVRRFWGAKVGVATIGVLAVFSPTFYITMTRPIPNYSLTLLFGTILLWIGARLATADFTKLRSEDRWWVAAFGLVAGFAHYTFALSSLYTLGILGVWIWRAVVRMPAWQLLWPFDFCRQNTIRQLLRAVSWLLIANFLFGGITFIFCSKRAFGIGWDPSAVMVSSIFGFGALWLSRLWLYEPGIRQALFLFIGSFIAGYFPALYYRLILGGAVRKSPQIRGDLSDVWTRLQHGLDYHMHMMGEPWVGGLASGALLCCLGGAVLRFCWQILKDAGWLAGHGHLGGTSLGRQRLPMLGLFVISLIVFALSRAVVDIWSGRYLTPLIPFYSLAIGSTICSLWRSGKRPALVAVMLGAAILQVWQFLGALQHEIMPVRIYRNVVEAFDAHGVDLGYGNYWYAYAVNFLSDERIRIEPIHSNYAPHYKQAVGEANTIGYVVRAKAPEIPVSHEGDVVLRGTAYRATATKDYGEFIFYLLQKKTNSP